VDIQHVHIRYENEEVVDVLVEVSVSGGSVNFNSSIEVSAEDYRGNESLPLLKSRVLELMICELNTIDNTEEEST